MISSCNLLNVSRLGGFGYIFLNFSEIYPSFSYVVFAIPLPRNLLDQDLPKGMFQVLGLFLYVNVVLF